MNSVAWVFLPYFAFLGVVIAGLHWDKTWVVVCGVVFFLFYDPKPELKIICSRTIYSECEFYTMEDKEKEK